MVSALVGQGQQGVAVLRPGPGPAVAERRARGGGARRRSSRVRNSTRVSTSAEPGLLQGRGELPSEPTSTWACTQAVARVVGGGRRPGPRRAAGPAVGRSGQGRGVHLRAAPMRRPKKRVSRARWGATAPSDPAVRARRPRSRRGARRAGGPAAHGRSRRPRTRAGLPPTISKGATSLQHHRAHADDGVLAEGHVLAHAAVEADVAALTDPDPGARARCAPPGWRSRRRRCRARRSSWCTCG